MSFLNYFTLIMAMTNTGHLPEAYYAVSKYKARSAEQQKLQQY